MARTSTNLRLMVPMAHDAKRRYLAAVLADASRMAGCMVDPDALPDIA